MAQTVVKKNLSKIAREIHEAYSDWYDYDIEVVKKNARKASLRDIRIELEALRNFFGKVFYGPRYLSVITDSITLEGVQLGRFQIEINPSDGDLAIEALDPNPYIRDSECTHPYVEGNEICLGEGEEAFLCAIDEGRYFDAFVIVNSILHSYAKGKGHYNLDDWEGVTCGICGKRELPEEMGECDDCHIDVCEDCTIICDDCGDCFCLSCVSECQDCEDLTCNNCLETCKECGKAICTGCASMCEECGEIFCEDHVEYYATLQLSLCQNCHKTLTLKLEKSDGKKKQKEAKRKQKQQKVRSKRRDRQRR